MISTLYLSNRGNCCLYVSSTKCIVCVDTYESYNRKEYFKSKDTIIYDLSYHQQQNNKLYPFSVGVGLEPITINYYD